MMGYGHDLGTGGWIALTIFWVALLALVVWTVTRIRSTGGAARSPFAGAHEEAGELLDRRFAAGELDVETYRSMRAALRETRLTETPRLSPARLVVPVLALAAVLGSLGWLATREDRPAQRWTGTCWGNVLQEPGPVGYPAQTRDLTGSGAPSAGLLPVSASDDTGVVWYAGWHPCSPCEP